MNAINPSYGYQMAQANAKAQGARLVSYTETEDMAASTITTDAKKPQTLEELQKELMAKYGVNQAGKTIEGIPASISVSPAFLQEALQNPEKMQWLEENLEAMQSLNTGMFAGTLTQVSYSIDAKGEITMITSGTSDPDGRIARENAKRKQEEERLKEKQEQKRLEEQKALEESLSKAQEAKQKGDLHFAFSVSGANMQIIQSKIQESLQSTMQNHLNMQV